MTSTEKDKVVEKGRKWLSAFLRQKLEEEAMADDVKKHLVKVACDVYREEMKDPGFFDMVVDFYGKRRTAAEKEQFCNFVMCMLVRSGKVKAEYARRYLDVSH